MMPKSVIKVICIIMAILMLLSVVAVVLQVFAADEGAILSYASPVTGDSGSDYIVPAGIAVAAVLAVVLCVFMPKMKKDEGISSGEKKAMEKKPAEKKAALKKTPDKKAVSQRPQSPTVKKVGKTTKKP